jgi:VanZ family protein
MELLGTHVPISWPAVLVLLWGILISHPVAGWLANALTWHRRASAAAWICLSVVLALTVTPDGSKLTDQGHCSPSYALQMWNDPLHASGGIGGGLLNVVLFLPLGTTLVLASRRAWIAVIMVLALPATIEVVQRLIPGRTCSIADYVINTAGGTLGVIIGITILSRRPSIIDTMK